VGRASFKELREQSLLLYLFFAYWHDRERIELQTARDEISLWELSRLVDQEVTILVISRDTSIVIFISDDHGVTGSSTSRELQLFLERQRIDVW